VVVTGVATFNNQVSIAGTLTYEDVTNVDSTGIITAKSGVKVTGGEILVGSGFSVGQAGIVTASGIRVGTAITIDATSGIITATSFSGPFSASTGSFTSDVDIADKIVHTGDTNTAIRFPAADTFTVETAGSEALRVDSGGRLLVGTDTAQTLPTASALQVSGDGFPGSSIRQTRFESGNSGPSLILAHARGSEASNAILNDDDELGKIRFYGHDGVDFNNWGAEIKALVDGTPGSDDMPGRLMFLTTADGGTQPTERLRITSRGGFQFSNGFMSETVKINTTARNGTQTVDLVDGMVHYFSTNSSGTWKPNFTMTGDDINATIATGDVFSPTMIVAKGATTHFANAIQVDGSDVTPEFSGGAPTDGGGSGTFDVYNYTIIKTGDDTFKAFAAVSTYE
jgi:hypothetical protein